MVRIRSAALCDCHRNVRIYFNHNYYPSCRFPFVFRRLWVCHVDFSSFLLPAHCSSLCIFYIFYVFTRFRVPTLQVTCQYTDPALFTDYTATGAIWVIPSHFVTDSSFPPAYDPCYPCSVIRHRIAPTCAFSCTFRKQWNN